MAFFNVLYKKNLTNTQVYTQALPALSVSTLDT